MRRFSRTNSSLRTPIRIRAVAKVPSKRLMGVATLITFWMTAASHAQNLILNGDFEFNTAGGTFFNMNNAQFNGTVANATAFGTAEEIDLMTGNPYGLPPAHGNWKLGIASESGGTYDAFSFSLSMPVMTGRAYRV